jgi:ABC-type multidrug transport system fused ATPase/permease subunit
MKQNFYNFLNLFNRKDYFSIAGLLALMVVGAALEMAGLTVLVPIIDVISTPEKLNDNETYQMIYSIIGAGSLEDFILRLSAIIVIYILCKNLFLAYVSLRQAKFIKNKEIQITNRLLASYLFKPYLEMSHRNSSDLIRNINQEVNYAFTIVVQPLFILISEIFVVSALLTLMIIVSPGATLLAFCILTSGVLFFLLCVKKIIKKFGSQRQNARGRMIEWATQALYSLKELLVARKEKYFLDRFDEQAQKTKEAETFDMAMGRIPVLFIEVFAIATMLMVMIYIFLNEENFIATLSLFALVLLRLMPTMNRVTVCASRIRFYWPSLNAVSQDLEQEIVENASQKSPRKLKFKDNFCIEDVSFTYPTTDNAVLKNVSLSISKGKIISIVGASGSGKTTFMDIMLGLLSPQSGRMILDGRDITKNIDGFRNMVSYLPQSVYLLNATIRENIAFGVEPSKIKNKKINDVLKKVGLDNMVNALPDDLETPIGDISKKISGGQQQRIGIARALYHDKDILFLDEATAGLDPKVEKTICDTLKSLTPDVTIISISHQHALINIADEIYTMDKGVLKPKLKGKK